MIGSIIGDIVGSIYEFDNIHTKDFELFTPAMSYTDDSILTFATAEWLLRGGSVARLYARYVAEYPAPMGNYGPMFEAWASEAAKGEIPAPYNSCGNGAAMRVGPVGWAAGSLERTLELAEESACCTHNHPEGIKGAKAVAHSVFLARHGAEAREIERVIGREYGYELSVPVSDLQRRYSWNGMDGSGNGGTCQDSVPQAISCALQASDFEDAVRNAISIGGDSDTIGCIAGSIAEPLFGVPLDIYRKAKTYLTPELIKILDKFEGKFGSMVPA